MSQSLDTKIEPVADKAAVPEMKEVQKSISQDTEKKPELQPKSEPISTPQTQTEPAQPEPDKKQKKRRRLKVAHPERCIGCLSCMFACSRIHTGRASLIDSCIKIQTQGGIEGDFRVVVCRGCENPPCVRACPSGALERRRDGTVRLNKSLCTKCGKCSEACLIGAISMGKEGIPIKCQHCGACVAFCPHGVLELEEVPA